MCVHVCAFERGGGDCRARLGSWMRTIIINNLGIVFSLSSSHNNCCQQSLHDCFNHAVTLPNVTLRYVSSLPRYEAA